jgi:tetratricopeptide (TPR) repeat protein
LNTYFNKRLKGNLDKAKRLLEESLEMREVLYGSGHIEIAANVENLGNVYFDMSDYHKARKFYERALVIKRSKL